MNNLKSKIKIADIYTIFMLTFYSVLAVIFSSQLEGFSGIMILNITLISIVFATAFIEIKFGYSKSYMLFRTLYIIPIVFVIYSQVQEYIPFLNAGLYDFILADWDRVIFGLNPTEWIYKFHNPFLTEYLQFSYMTYYLIPIVFGVELQLRNDKSEFDYMIRNVIFAFYLSYLAYFFMPAIGPRFILHDFMNLSNELPGVWLAEFFRYIVNSGGGIPTGAFNPAEMVNRDCMPSGHTWITLVNVFLAFRFKSKFRWVFLIFGISLIIATIYLRYHYVVDVIAGIIMAFVSIKIEPYIKKFLSKYLLNRES